MKEDGNLKGGKIKMKKLTIMTVFLALMTIQLAAQYNQPSVTEPCGTMENFERLSKQDPGYQQRLNELEERIKQYVSENQGNLRVNVTIPVVVHIVYNTPAQNIPDTQVVRQIEIMNTDFRKLNSDISKLPSWFAPLAADCQINFCLATLDPKNKPTSGITRTSTSRTSFTGNDWVKSKNKGGADAWATDKYLNIWVCNLDGGLIGYAQFPGGPPRTDGIVVDYQVVGMSPNNFSGYNLGRTANHEVGHWLNLRHIWGDDGTACTGTDYVGDTPNHAGPDWGCFADSTIVITCNNGPYGNMWMNYMDYTYHPCMYMFSNGQADRMQAIFATNQRRASLLTSNGCGQMFAPVTENSNESFGLLYNYPNPFNPTTTISFTLPSAGYTTLKVYSVLGEEIAELVNGNLDAGSHSIQFDGSNIASGIYYYRLEAAGKVDVKKMLLVK